MVALRRLLHVRRADMRRLFEAGHLWLAVAVGVGPSPFATCRVEVNRPCGASGQKVGEA